MSELYLAGEPLTDFEASLMITFDFTFIQQNEDDPDYDEEAISQYQQTYSLSEPMLHVTFNQVDIENGRLVQITKVLPIKGAFSESIFELSRNELIDRNDYLGIFFSDPEPVSFFSLENTIRTLANDHVKLLLDD